MNLTVISGVRPERRCNVKQVFKELGITPFFLKLGSSTETITNVLSGMPEKKILLYDIPASEADRIMASLKDENVEIRAISLHGKTSRFPATNVGSNLYLVKELFG